MKTYILVRFFSRSVQEHDEVQILNQKQLEAFFEEMALNEIEIDFLEKEPSKDERSELGNEDDYVYMLFSGKTIVPEPVKYATKYILNERD